MIIFAAMAHGDGVAPERKVIAVRKGAGLEGQGASRWVLALALLAICLANPLVSWGHLVPASTEPHPQHGPVTSAAPVPWLPSSQPNIPATHPSILLSGLLLLATLAFAGVLWRRRRVTALGLVLVLGTFTFAVGIHAVHHLDTPEQAAECLVFAASQHVAGTLAETLDLGTPSASDEGALFISDETLVPTLFYRPAQQRAPPARLA
jgi:hypothetical protein